MSERAIPDAANERASLPPGWYTRMIIAASKGIGGRPVPLGDIQLGTDELLIAEMVSSYLARDLEDLSVEQRVQWGALYLFLWARSDPSPSRWPVLSETVTQDQFEWIRKGASFWEGRAIDGARQAYRAFHATLLAEGRLLDDAQGKRTTSTAWCIEAEVMPEVLGRNRLRVRVVESEIALERNAEAISLVLRVPAHKSIVVIIDDAPGALFSEEGVELRVGPDWTEVLFRLEGATEEYVPIELVASDCVESVAPLRIEHAFAVTTASPALTSLSRSDPAPMPTRGVARILAELKALKARGSDNEVEVRRVLGLPTSFRRFLFEFEGHGTTMGMSVHIEITPTPRPRKDDGT